MNVLDQLIFLEPNAASKPGPGAPCNGCGVCCQLAPCPLGVVLSGRRQGACVAVRWCEDRRQYRCGALSEPSAVLQSLLPRAAHPLVGWLGPVLARLARRWISVVTGCDSSVEASALSVPLGRLKISPTMRNDSSRNRP